MSGFGALLEQGYPLVLTTRSKELRESMISLWLEDLEVIKANSFFGTFRAGFAERSDRVPEVPQKRRRV